jgi:hypothetical protein
MKNFAVSDPKPRPTRARFAASVKALQRTPSLAPIALSLFMLAAAFVTGIQSGISGTVSHLHISLIGLTSALSFKAHGLTGHPYAGYQSVEDQLMKSGLEATPRNFPQNFRNTPLVTAALQAGAAADTCGSGLVFHPENDQGLIDYIRGAFWLFGIDVAALYNFYFVLVAISVLLYLICYWRDYSACLLLFACLCAIYSFMPSYIYNDTNLISVANSRFASTVGIIPLLHIMLLIWRNDRQIGWPSLATAIGQAMLVSFAYAVRASSQWMFLAAAALLLLCTAKPLVLVARHRALAAIKPSITGRLPIALVFAATVMTFGAARNVYLVPPCGTALNAHPVWHSIFYGLSLHPDWVSQFSATYDDKRGDELVYAAAKHYVERHHLPYQTRPSIWVTTPETARTGVDPMPFGSWSVYEDIIRSAFFEFSVEHPRFVIENFLFYKPQQLIRDLKYFLRTVWSDLTPAKSALFVAIIAVLTACGLANTEARAARLPLAGLAAVMLISFISSLVPLLLAYSDSHLISDQAYLLVTSIVAGILFLAHSGAKLARLS